MLKVLLILSALLGICLSILQYPGSPENVAIHFGSGGKPDSWIPAQWSLLLGIGIQLSVTVLFLCIGSIFRKVPLKWINFPKKHYWLAPERLEQNLPRICNWFYFYGTLLNIFLIATGELVAQANLRGSGHLDQSIFLLFLGIFFAITIVWTIMLYVRFWKIPEDTRRPNPMF